MTDAKKEPDTKPVYGCYLGHDLSSINTVAPGITQRVSIVDHHTGIEVYHANAAPAKESAFDQLMRVSLESMGILVPRALKSGPLEQGLKKGEAGFDPMGLADIAGAGISMISVTRDGKPPEIISCRIDDPRTTRIKDEVYVSVASIHPARFVQALQP